MNKIDMDPEKRRIIIKSLKLIAPILLIIGTSGLLVNEFLLQWGRSATLVFAGISSLGFVILGIAIIRNRDVEDMK